MGFLLRTFLGTVLVGAAIYTLFFVTLDDRPVGSHLLDIWRSPVVQSKVDLVKRGVEDKLREELAKTAPKAHARLSADKRNGSQDELSDADRRSLAKLVGEAEQAE